MNKHRSKQMIESNQDCNFFDTLNSKAINYNIEQAVKNTKKDVTIIQESYCPSSPEKILLNWWQERRETFCEPMVQI